MACEICSELGALLNEVYNKGDAYTFEQSIVDQAVDWLENHDYPTQVTWDEWESVLDWHWSVLDDRNAAKMEFFDARDEFKSAAKECRECVEEHKLDPNLIEYSPDQAPSIDEF